MRKILAAAVAVLAVALAAPALATVPAAVKHAKLNDGDFFFSPGTLHIKRGTKVVWKWVNDEGVAHNIWVLHGPAKFHSGLRTSGSYSHVFNKPGTYILYCRVHTWMTEKVIVK